MKKIIILSSFLFLLSIKSYADTITHVYENDSIITKTVIVEREVSESMLESKSYNQALVSFGLVGVIVIVGGFAYMLTQKKH